MKDQFISKYGQYLDYRLNANVVKETIDQLEKNYESAFDEKPTPSEMEKAIKFVSLFLAEIAETCPNTRQGNAAIIIADVIEEGMVVSTAQNIVRHHSR